MKDRSRYVAASIKNPFTMSKKRADPANHRTGQNLAGENRVFISGEIGADPQRKARGPGGAYRDRTDDLKLAKLALSQLS